TKSQQHAISAVSENRITFAIMIRTYAQIGEEQLFAARMQTFSVWLGCHEDFVNVFERFGIGSLQDPALFVYVVFKQYAAAVSSLLVRPSSSPHLEGAGILPSQLTVQIIGV